MRGSLGRRMIVVVGGVMALMLACVAGRIWLYVNKPVVSAHRISTVEGGDGR